MKRIVKRPDERKAELLDIAINLFMQKGYDNTSIKDIYSEASGSFGMFYHHFKSKEEVFDMAMNKYVHDFISNIYTILLNKSVAYQERYCLLIKNYIGFLEGRDKVCNYERSAIDVSVFRQLSLKMLSESIHPIEQFLEEGVEKEILFIEDVNMATTFIVYGIYGIIREQGLIHSNNNNAIDYMIKSSKLIAKILDTDTNVFNISQMDIK